MSEVQRKPNILLVFSDQHRWCDLGCYGNGDVISPNLDAFSGDALRFECCVSSSPVCVPARGSLLTGLLPLRHGAVTNDLPIRTDVESLAHVLSRAGYHTGYIGKWHLGGVPRDRYIPRQERLGFEEWKVCNCNHSYMRSYYYDEDNIRTDISGYEPITQTDLAVDFIERNKEESWLLTLSYSPPHDPYHELPRRYEDLYRDREIKLRENMGQSVKLTKDRYISREDMTDEIKGYYAHITALDEQFGRIIQALEHSGQLDDTIVVYTSDHGDMLGSQGSSNKQQPYEESIRVPLMVYWKGHTIRGTIGELISLTDLPVSLLGLVGQSFSGQTDGRDLHKIFTEREAKGLEECYIFDLIPCHQAYSRGDCEWRGIRTKRYTYAKNPYEGGVLLYDNLEDPFQLRNLIGSPLHTDIRDELDESLNGLIKRNDAFLTWDELIRTYALTEQWNKSQEYFGMSIIK